jgi:hypothetical protein
MPEITLLKNHTHAGVMYLAGGSLQVDPATQQWLIDQDIAALKPDGSAQIAAGPASTTASLPSSPSSSSNRKDSK